MRRGALHTAQLGWPDFVEGPIGVPSRGYGGYGYGAVFILDTPSYRAPSKNVMETFWASYTYSAGFNFKFFSCTVSGTTATVRDVSAPNNWGSDTLAGDFGITGQKVKFEAGDRLGFWAQDATQTTTFAHSGSGGSHSLLYVGGTAANPVPGTVYSGLSSNSYSISVQAYNV